MGVYWTGTGFEERMNPMPPPPADSATSESQPPIALESASDSSAPARGEFPSTQDRALQKISQDIDKRFLLQGDPTHAESQKQDDDADVGAGLVSYDHDLGSWVRAQEVPASVITSEGPEVFGQAAASVRNEVEQSQKKSSRESGSLFKWTSWFRTEFRTEPEQGRVLMTPPPEKSSEVQLQSAAVPDDAPAAPSSGAAQDLPAPEVQIPVAEEVASVSASSLADTQGIATPDAETTADPSTAAPAPPLSTSQDVIISDPATAVADESTLVSAPSPAMAQDTTAPDATVAVGDQVASVPVTTSAPGDKPEGRRWQSAVEQREGIAPSARSVTEIRETTPGPDKSRWFMLNNVLGRAAERRAPAPEPEGGVPVLQVFSLAGGTGKTSLVATLGRTLSARDERVLLVEATPLAARGVSGEFPAQC
jgi:hypothetical protein